MYSPFNSQTHILVFIPWMGRRRAELAEQLLKFYLLLLAKLTFSINKLFAMQVIEKRTTWFNKKGDFECVLFLGGSMLERGKISSGIFSVVNLLAKLNLLEFLRKLMLEFLITYRLELVWVVIWSVVGWYFVICSLQVNILKNVLILLGFSLKILSSMFCFLVFYLELTLGMISEAFNEVCICISIFNNGPSMGWN